MFGLIWAALKFLVVFTGGMIVGVRWFAPWLKWVKPSWARALFGMLAAACVWPAVACAQAVDTTGWTHDSTVAGLDTTGWVRDSTPVWHYDSTATTATRWHYDSLPITQPHPVPSASHPNEPKGYAPSRSLDGTRVPTWPLSTAGYPLGQWYGYAVGNVSLVGTALQTRFPKGLIAGNGPANFGGYDATKRELSGIYLSEWVQIVGKDFENHPAGTKAGFIAVGRNMQGENEVFPFLTNPSGVQTFQSAFPMEIRQQGIPQPNGSITRNLTQNVDRRVLMTAGSWHHWEVVLTLNAIGQANGTARMWIDGVLVMSYSNVVFRTAAYPRGFTLYKWNPTWGGKLGFTKTRADFIQLKDIYLSGVP